MDAILTRVGVSDAEIRTHCLNAVHDEMQQAEKRLLKALKVLKRALQVAEASRELHKSPLALVDASPDVSAALTRVVSSCNDVGPLMRKLHHAVNAPGVAAVDHQDAPSSATEDEDEESAAPHEIVNLVDEHNEPDTELTATRGLGIEVFDHAAPRGNDEVVARTSSRPLGRSTPSTSTPQSRSVWRVMRPFARATHTKTEPLPPRRPSSRKRKVPERYLDPLSLPPVKKLTAREVLGKETDTCSARRIWVGGALMFASSARFHAKDRGVDIAEYMDDIQAVVTVTVPNIVQREVRMERSELRAILVLLQRLPHEFPEKAKLRRYIAAKYETPAEEVSVIRERLDKMLVELRGWCRDDTYTVFEFENHLQFVKETMEGLSYEGYEPHWDKTIAELLFRFGCCLQAFETGWAQDRRYDSIRLLLYDMRRAERRR